MIAGVDCRERDRGFDEASRQNGSPYCDHGLPSTIGRDAHSANGQCPSEQDENQNMDGDSGQPSDLNQGVGKRGRTHPEPS